MGFAAFASGFGPDNGEVSTILTDCGVATSQSGNEEHFDGTCNISPGSPGRINVSVTNNTGVDLTNIQPRLLAQDSSGSKPTALRTTNRMPMGATYRASIRQSL